MKLPSISVITPSFNQGAFIARTLASVANQSHPPLEHLIFDGGSSDNTLAVLRQAGGSVRWVSRPDGGQADAVNHGLKAARGDVIAWIYSDDIYYPQAFAQVAARFAADPSIDVVYGDADHIDLQDQPFEPYPTAVWDPWLLPHVCFICQPALFFRRQVLDRVGLLNPNLRYCMDYEFWLRLANAGCRFTYLPVKLAGSRLYPSNKTLADRPAVHHEIAEMLLTRNGTVPLRWVVAYANHSAASRWSPELNPWRYRHHALRMLIRQQWHWNRTPGLRSLAELLLARRRQRRLRASLTASS